MPRTARALLLRDTGWWDYDLASCHLRILRDLGRHLGLSTDAIDRYLKDKKRAHTSWAEAIRHDHPDDFKQIILSFQNGARRSSEPETTLGDLLGPEKATSWLQREYVQEFLTEISEIVKQEVTQATVGRSCVNVLGLTREAATYPQACSHIWTGYEVWIMRELLTRLAVIQPGALKAYIYDGFISGTRLSDEQITDVESHVRRRSVEAMGVELSITLKATPFAAAKRADLSTSVDKLRSEGDARDLEEDAPEMQEWLASCRQTFKHIDKT
jgi:hypothetical protein